MSEPQRFRKKPVVIEAMRWDGSTESAQTVCRWANAGMEDPYLSCLTASDCDGPFDFQCETVAGPLLVSPGDWIIKGVTGEFHPCKPDIFDATYELADRETEGFADLEDEQQ